MRLCKRSRQALEGEAIRVNVNRGQGVCCVKSVSVIKVVDPWHLFIALALQHFDVEVDWTWWICRHLQSGGDGRGARVSCNGGAPGSGGLGLLPPAAHLQAGLSLDAPLVDVVDGLCVRGPLLAVGGQDVADVAETARAEALLLRGALALEGFDDTLEAEVRVVDEGAHADARADALDVGGVGGLLGRGFAGRFGRGWVRLREVVGLRGAADDVRDYLQLAVGGGGGGVRDGDGNTRALADWRWG